jgi:hypothetical protein
MINRIYKAAPVAALFFMLWSAGAAAQHVLVVEYAVYVEEDTLYPGEELLLPVQVLMAIKDDKVLLRGVWPYASGTYQLYVPAERAEYHCDPEDEVASKFNFQPQKNVLPVAGATDTIAGFACRKALVVSALDTFPVYYTDDIGMNFCQIADVPGFALRYTKRIAGVKVTYEAINYRMEEIPPHFFTLQAWEIVDRRFDEPVASARVGRKAPGIRTRLLNGKAFGSEDYKDKVLVVNFHRTELGAPQLPRAAYWLSALARRYENKSGVLFLSVNFEDEHTLRALFGTEQPRRLRIAPHAENLAAAFGVKAFPATIVINKKGKIALWAAEHNLDIDARLTEAIDVALDFGRR